ncbi:MAG: hypothetical protein D6732_10770 [Methanobacteriota archaeon]|nr:MAG: hypothetical protein D6732_10770 [Euryarchaeota archaeon]
MKVKSTFLVFMILQLLIVGLSFSGFGNNQTLQQDDGIGYVWDFFVEEVDFNGDLDNDTIVVAPSVVFNTTVIDYSFDLLINIYWLNNTEFVLIYEEFDFITANVSADEPVSSSYEFLIWEPGLYQVNVTITDSQKFDDTGIIMHSRNVTIEGAVSEDPFVFDYGAEFLDQDGDGCNETVNFFFNVVGYNQTGEMKLHLTIMNSTNEVVEEKFSSGFFYNLYETYSDEFLWFPTEMDTYTINFTVIFNNDVIINESLEWTPDCAVPTFDPITLINDTEIPTQTNFTEITGNETSGAFILSLPFMSAISMATTLSLLIIIAKRGKKHE